MPQIEDFEEKVMGLNFFWWLPNYSDKQKNVMQEQIQQLIKIIKNSPKFVFHNSDFFFFCKYAVPQEDKR